LFKLLFVKHPHLLKQLVARLLGIPPESIGEFVITNPEMPPESLSDKFCRLDIAMTVDGQMVDLEVQVNDEGDYPERALYYWAREFSTALPAGGKYNELPRTIVASIVNFNLFGCAEYCSAARSTVRLRGVLFGLSGAGSHAPYTAVRQNALDFL
jgi:predicted transposase/invertase (TIGR01784 family)